VQIVLEAPTIQDYLKLRRVSGLRERTTQAAEIGLKSSLFAVTLYMEGGEAIGMGRVVGDGGCNFEVVDIAVHPDYQGQGYGRLIMEHIMDFLRKNVPKGSYVSLIANTPWLYEKFGFEPCAPRLTGMHLRW
jgi:GNAT superfamily N-acetyltransferase